VELFSVFRGHTVIINFTLITVNKKFLPHRKKGFNMMMFWNKVAFSPNNISEDISLEGD